MIERAKGHAGHRNRWRYRSPEERIKEKIARIAWCRRRVADEVKALGRMLDQHPELGGHVGKGPVLVVDNRTR